MTSPTSHDNCLASTVLEWRPELQGRARSTRFIKACTLRRTYAWALCSLTLDPSIPPRHGERMDSATTQQRKLSSHSPTLRPVIVTTQGGSRVWSIFPSGTV